MKDYKEQIGRILDLKKIEFRYNSEWLSRLKFAEVTRLASLFTVHQLIDRRNFKERYAAGKVIGFHEFLYPLMQGYDSVAVKADVEIGGTDQLFNLLAGRKIQEFFGQEAQDIMTLEMLDGLDGRKMSTSYGNVVNITDEPKEMFGKIMSLKDELIIPYFKLATDASLAVMERLELDLEDDRINPMEAKKQLAYEIVKMYYGAQPADKAADSFTKIFQKQELPKEAPILTTKKGEELCKVFLKEKQVSSRGACRRLIKDGAIDFEGMTVKDVHYKINKSGIVRIGKKKFLKIEIA